MLQLKSTVKIAGFTHGFKTFDGGDEIRMAFQQSTPPPKDLPILLECALEEISEIRKLPVKYMLINTIPPEHHAKIHTDTLKVTEHLERWHLPITTNPHAWYWCEKEGFIHFPLGYWSGPVEYWERHTAGNFGPQDRTHLVVDLG